VNVRRAARLLAGWLLRHDESHRLIFLVGILPALHRRCGFARRVPETEEWKAAREAR